MSNLRFISCIFLLKVNEKNIKKYHYTVYFMGYRTVLKPTETNKTYGSSSENYECNSFCKQLYQKLQTLDIFHPKYNNIVSILLMSVVLVEIVLIQLSCIGKNLFILLVFSVP